MSSQISNKAETKPFREGLILYSVPGRFVRGIYVNTSLETPTMPQEQRQNQKLYQQVE